jgi:NADH-quinone oxidoreductase subunit C
MSFAELQERLRAAFDEQMILGVDEASMPQAIILSTEALLPVCEFLHKTEGFYFDLLSCITGLDNGPEAGSMEVVYNLYSIPYAHALMLKVQLPRNAEGEPLPSVPSVSHIWRTADWHEREVYDLLGIHFSSHPDLRRILLPTDWEGHPLRKDYTEQEYYHGIHVRYDREDAV